MAMKEAKLKDWQDKLERADAEWKDRGLSGGDSDLAMLNDMYRGEDMMLAQSMGTMATHRLSRVNSMFESLNQLEAQTAARAPRVQLFPRSPHAANLTRPAESLINYFVRELQMKRQVNRAWKDSFLSPVGVVTHGYTPSEEFTATRRGKTKLLEHYGNAKPDVPWVRRYPIWDVRIDTERGSLHPAEASWFMRRSLMTEDQIKQNPAMTFPRDLKATVKVHPSLAPGRDRFRTRTDGTEFYEVWTVYNRLDETWFQFSPGSRQALRDEDDWPLPWDELPYDLFGVNDQMDDPFPVPYGQVIAPIHKDREILRTMMSQLVRSLRRMIFLNEDGLAQGEKEKIVDGMGPALIEFFRTAGLDPNMIMKEVQVGGFPQELLMYEQVLVDDIRKKLNQSEMDRANRINAESASEAVFVQQGSETARGRNQAHVEDVWRSVIRKWTQGARATMTGEQIVPIVGIEDAETLIAIQGQDAEPFLRVPADAIKQDYLVDIQVGSTLPRSKAEEINIALKALEIGSQFPENANIQELLTRVFRAMDLDPEKVLISPEARARTQALLAAQGQQPGSTVEPGGGIEPLTALGGGQ